MAVREPIWIVPAGVEDQYGDDGPSGTPVYVPGAIVLPRKSTESAQGGVIVISGYEVFLKPPPAGLVISASDSIIIRGTEQQIEGEPGLYARKALQFFTRRIGSSRGATVVVPPAPVAALDGGVPSSVFTKVGLDGGTPYDNLSTTLDGGTP